MAIRANSNSQNWTEKTLSNLYGSVFFLDGFYFRSVESLLQGVKFPLEDSRRIRAFSSCGRRARKLSAEAGSERVWLLDGKEAPYGSPEHVSLLEKALRAKFDQNPVLMQALVSTGDKPIVCGIKQEESPRISFLKGQFCRILEDIRKDAAQKDPAGE